MTRGATGAGPTAAVLVLLAAGCAQAAAQETTTWHASPIEETRPLFTEFFQPSQFAERRGRVYDEIDPNAIAVVQGASSPMGSVAFRQPNEFYHLTGVEAPHASLMLDGAEREAILYLMPREERREYGEGKCTRRRMES